MLDALRSIFAKTSEHWFVDVSQPGFVSSATVEPAEYAKKKDHSHVLTFRFEEPVRDGNNVSHLNLRDSDGKIVGQRDLIAGERATDMELNPRRMTLDAVAVTNDGDARDTSRLDIYKEAVDP